MAITDTATLPPAVREYYDRLLLMTAYPMLVHTRMAQQRVLPKNVGDTIVFRRYPLLSTVPIPLDDGVTPPGAPLSASTIQARISWYGNFVTITDQVQLVVEDPVLNQASKLLSQNMGQTIDEVTRDVLASTASVISCANGVNGNTPTEITKSDIDSAVFTLMGNNAKMFTKVITGTDAYGTAPIRASFYGYMDTALLDDLEAVSNFVPTSQYPSQKGIDGAEWGATGNVRWLYTSEGSVSAAATPVYDNFIVGEEAYAVVSLGSDKGEFYVNQLGSAGSADPLHQRGTVGWKKPYVSRILNDSFLVNLQATHS